MIFNTFKQKTVFYCFFSLFSLLCLWSVPNSLVAQNAPKRELRGVWIATVTNIDFPSRPSTDPETLKRMWLDLLDQHKAMGINTLYVQVRPMSDALYPSDIVPWSRYLTGKSGVPPADNFDPMAFMIQSAHEYGMDFHAWLNPYRVTMDNADPSQLSSQHVLNAHPEWCIKYNKRYLLNPGLPEVRAHLEAVVTELVQKYPLDGIHFDDYFYPYKNEGEKFRDEETFLKYSDGMTNIEDWRRTNVDLLIYNLSQIIKKYNPRLQFGISPFGVWRNQDRDPEGSATRAGVTCYDDLYADVRKWLQAGWIDYVVPQVYWQMGFNIADHETLVRWWAQNAAGKPVYVGLGAYRVGQATPREPGWSDPNEIPRQIRLSREVSGIKGTVLFSSKSLISNRLGIGDSLRQNYFRTPALVPQVYKDTSLLACEPPELRPITADQTAVTLRWQASQQTQRRQPFQYVVYRFELGKVNFSQGDNILAIIPFYQNDLSYTDRTAQDGVTYIYAVTVVDCQHAETMPYEVVTIRNGLEIKASAVPNIQPQVLEPKMIRTKKPNAWRRFKRWLFG